MRVAVVGPVHPYRGGVSQFTSHLARELGTRHDVLVLSWRRQYPRWLYPGGDQLAAPLPEDGAAGPRFLLDYRNPVTLGRGARLIRSWRPDVVVITWITTFAAPFYLILLWLLRRSLPPGVRIIAVCHNVLPHERRPYDRALTAATLRRVDAAIVHASEMLTDLAEVAPHTPGIVIPMPEFGPVNLSPRVPPDELRRREGLGDRVLLFFGYVRPYKGLRQLLEAMKIALAELTVDLLVVGQFWEPKAQYEALIEQLGIGDHVRVVDRYVADDEVADWFEAADVVVMPYVAATQSAVAALAFQQRRPVISTAVGGIPEAVEDGVTGLIVPPRDPAALAAAIMRFYREGLGPGFTAAIEQRPGGAWDRYVAGLLALATPRTGSSSGSAASTDGGNGDREVG
jgi:glycosyltransferase involved in cell wall biosynthesis